MADQIPVVCPSRNRVGKVKTVKWLPGLIFYVHESEVKTYRKAYPDQEVVGHQITTGIPTIRQDIYERFGDCFQVDDDCTRMNALFTVKGAPPINAEGDHALDLIQRLYEEAIDLDVYTFGFCSFPHPASFKPFDPYHLYGHIGGHALGLRKHPDLYFNTELTAVADYWMTCLNAHFNRMCLIDMRWCVVQTKTFRATGGVSRHRLKGTEQHDNELLEAAFGPAIQPKKATSLAGLTHADERTVRLPF